MFEVRVFLDRREGDYAVLLVGPRNVSVNWPADLLPPDAAPGDYLSMRLRKDRTATEDSQKRVEDLIRRLSGGDETPQE